MAAPFSSRTGRVALGGILTTGALLMLYMASIAPSGRFGLTAVAGVFPVFAILLSGRTTGFLVWFASSVLGFILVPDKAISLCFLLILGVYPVIKHYFEQRRNRVAEWTLKLAFASIALVVLRIFLLGILMYELPEWIAQYNVLFFGVGLISFILYDVALSRLIAFLITRVIKRK